ncbi:ADP-ribosylglycohydrolase [Actinomadura madurae]|uniref:ADP-ribosylglycohydrolase n=2 Tax=Thermomonosporaceae TaxID=2012 RepID=A0A1I4XIN5_9ACTN|nr:ADP-ribosylglycohydrolase [Actinomadura madurae]
MAEAAAVRAVSLPCSVMAETMGDRMRGCLFGGAVGEALGRPVEGMSLEAIREAYGPGGVTGYTGRPEIGEATQLCLLTAQAGLQASIRARSRGIGGAYFGLVQSNYLSWMRVQGERFPAGDLHATGPALHAPAVMARRGVSRTTRAALLAAGERGKPGWPLGTVDEPVNDSKGCAGTVRAAPAGFGHPDPEAVFARGQGTAALTHGHPSGRLPAGALAVAVSALVHGAALADAVRQAMAELRKHPGHEETAAALDRAVELAGSGRPSPERVESLGRGFTGPEALAIAVHAALAAEAGGGYPLEIVPRGLLLAVNHSGDSDSTGALCGHLLGARYGARAVPEHWRDTVEAGAAIIELAHGSEVEFGPNPPGDAYGEPPLEWHMRFYA